MKFRSLFKQKDYGDMIIYQLHCDCLSNDHQQTLILEYDDQADMISMSICGEIYAGSYSTSRFINALKRIWLALKMLFTGQLKAEGGVLISGEENVADLINGLSKGLLKMKEFKNDVN